MDNINIIDSWESVDSPLAPLSTKQIEFINKLEALCKPSNKMKEEMTKNKAYDSKGSDRSEMSQFTNLYDFEQWYDAIERDISPLKDHRFTKLTNYYDECKQLISDVSISLEHLNKLQNEYLFVSNKTNALHNACDILLQQQHGLIVAVETINERLTYFKELEPMSKKLLSPTMLVLSESLMPMLTRLDECINYLESKQNYKESSLYLKQFRHLQSQALSTIKTHVINTLQQTSLQVMPQSKDALEPNDSVFTLFYGKFQNNAHRIKTLMQQIEERSEHLENYRQYLLECHQCYFNIRESLIGPVFTMAIDDMVLSHKRNFCALIRSSSTMLTHICRDEHQLYFQFFTQISESLNEFLDKMCLKLYDILRPIIIHLEHLETLSEICSIIKSEMIEESVTNRSLELQSFVKIMQQLLQDTQERLVYRANIYIETNIIGYAPAPGDLAYPEKLEMMENIAESVDIKSNLNRCDSVCSVASTALSDISLSTNDRNYDFMRRQIQFNRSPADLHGMWYPTVRRTLMCLSKLYRSLDKPTFQGLSQEVLAACIESLESAHYQIVKRKTLLDGQLFFIKHLLIIREQIAPFHIEITLKEVSLDFSRTKSAAFEFIQKRENLFTLTTNNSLLRFLFEGAPEVTEKVVDSQKAVDNKIKKTCENFIAQTTEYLLSNLISLINLIKTLHENNQLKNHNAFSSIENTVKTITEAFEHFKTNLPHVQRSMTLYLANRDTEAILFRPIKLSINQRFDEIKKLIQLNYSEDEQKMIAFPSLE